MALAAPCIGIFTFYAYYMHNILVILFYTDEENDFLKIITDANHINFVSIQIK